MTKLILSVLSLSILTAPAWAQDYPADQEIAHYVAVNTGLIDVDVDLLDESFNDAAVANSFTVGSRLGYGKVSIEGSRFETNDFSDSVLGVSSALNLEGYSMRIMGRAQFARAHALVGGFGYHVYDATASAGTQSMTVSGRQEDRSLILGWEMDTSRLFVRALFERYDVESGSDVAGLNVGVGFKFGPE